MRNTSTYCTAKLQLLKIMERDMSSRSEKARETQAILIVFLKVNGKEGAVEWEMSGPFCSHFSDGLFRTLRCKDYVFGLAILALRFLWFQGSSVDFQKPVSCFAKSRCATQKHKNEDGRGRRHIYIYICMYTIGAKTLHTTFIVGASLSQFHTPVTQL